METSEAREPWTSLLLLERLRSGDEPAAATLFARYFGRLTGLARRRMSARLSRRADPEDVAMSAYRSFFVGAREGRYVLGRGGDLWRLLSAIALHKLLKKVRHEEAARRSIQVELPIDRVAEDRIVRTLAGSGPMEDLTAADELDWIASRLDTFGRRVLELRLQGLLVPEIARDSGRLERSVRRSLARIRELMADRIDLASRSPSRESAGPVPLVASGEVPAASVRNYRIRRMIGAGRMGKVYRASPLSRGPDVAVKFLRKPLLERPDVVRRFLDEAQIVAGLRHPNIVPIHGFGRTDGGSYFLVLELVDGGDLAVRLAGSPVAEAEAIDWTIQLCEAVEHAHGRGVVHCDLKPANILIDGRGRIRVSDFGLARSIARVDDPRRAGAIEGTAPFMAPEQVSRIWGSIDRRTDVYGIGAVLFTLLTGRPPIVGPGLADILAEVIATTALPCPGELRPDLSRCLVEVCRRCLSKSPADRYPSVREVRSALAEAREDTSPRPSS